MICAFCLLEFDEKLVQRSCGGCFKVGSCVLVKCPRCGYETPPEPQWLKRINQKFRKGECNMTKEITLSDRAQEILEKAWIENRENKTDWKLDIVYDDPLFSELTQGGYAKANDASFELTEKGWSEACNCVRRHRLAECLLSDVLDIKKEVVHDIGCKFEHVLQKNVEENICTLLGHPKKCPHGKPIPEGDCCRDNRRNPRRLMIPLAECEVSEQGKIAYVSAHDGNTINKLTAMGVLPGLSIRLLRKKPSYLFQIGESQFAIDHSLAEKIHVRLA